MRWVNLTGGDELDDAIFSDIVNLSCGSLVFFFVQCILLNNSSQMILVRLKKKNEKAEFFRGNVY